MSIPAHGLRIVPHNRNRQGLLSLVAAGCISASAGASLIGGFTFYYGGTGDPPVNPNPGVGCAYNWWVKSSGCPYIVEYVQTNCQRTVLCDASACPLVGCGGIFALTAQPGLTSFNDVSYPIAPFAPALDNGDVASIAPVSFSKFRVFSLTTGDQIAVQAGADAGTLARIPASGLAVGGDYAVLGEYFDGRLCGFSSFRRVSASGIEDIPCEVQWTNGFGGAPYVQFLNFTGPNDGVMIRQSSNFAIASQFITHNAFACPCDLNADQFVDDMDFSVFIVAYEQLVCSEPASPETCPADFTGDSVVDDSDFQVFVRAYNEFICP